MRRKMLAAALMVLLGFVGAALYAAAVQVVYVHHPGSFYFLDVSPDSPHNEDIGYAVEYGVTSGYFDGTYRPEDPVTRQQMASFVMRASAEDPVVSVLIVDDLYFDGYYFGITALNEGRITQEEYETFQSFVDWWFGLSDYESTRSTGGARVTTALKLAKEVMARARASRTQARP
jgi:hypothetical protein